MLTQFQSWTFNCSFCRRRRAFIRRCFVSRIIAEKKCHERNVMATFLLCLPIQQDTCYIDCSVLVSFEGILCIRKIIFNCVDLFFFLSGFFYCFIVNIYPFLPQRPYTQITLVIRAREALPITCAISL